MANIEINDITLKTTPVGTDEQEIQETGGGTSKKVTIQSIWDEIAQGAGKFISTDEIRARSASGLKLYDDAGNGIFVEDGGQIGIGITTPGSLLHVQTSNGGSDGYLKITDIVNGGDVRFGMASGVNNDAILGAWSSNRVAFFTNSTERMQISSGGLVGIGMSPGKDLDVAGEIRASTGILFGTDTAAANTLDDYEEGIFTPGISFGGGTTGITYTTQVGRYTKIGNHVVVHGYIKLSSKGTSTGNAKITNLPFTSNNTSSNYSATSKWFNQISNINDPQVYVGYNVTTFTLQSLNTTTGSVSFINDSNFVNNSEIMFHTVYEV